MYFVNFCLLYCVYFVVLYLFGVVLGVGFGFCVVLLVGWGWGWLLFFGGENIGNWELLFCLYLFFVVNLDGYWICLKVNDGLFVFLN